MADPIVRFREIYVGKVPFVASDKATLPHGIPRVNAIRWLLLNFKVVVAENNTANPTEVADTILNIIKKIKVIIDGDDTKINYDGRKAFYLEKIEKSVEPPNNKDTLLGQNATVTYYFQHRIDFASNRLDQTDISALLPAKKYAKLDLEIEWGALTDMFSANTGGTSITAASSGCEVEMREAYLDNLDENDKFAKGELVAFRDYREGVQSKTVDRAYGNLTDDAFELEIKPAPTKILKQLVFTKDTNGLKSNAIITDISVQDTRGAGVTYFKRKFETFNREMKNEFQIESLDDGLILIDWIEKNAGGLDNLDTEGSLKFKCTTPAPTGTPKLEVLTRYLKGRA